MSARSEWWAWLAEQASPRVVEVGTKAWYGLPPRHHRDPVMSACPSASWVGVDAEAGDGVDVVADVHRLSAAFPEERFDAMICVATLEHFARPWVAAVEMARVLRPGARAWVESHQSFPIHGYPSDYFRFTVEGLRELFSDEAGWRIIASEYFTPCIIVPKINVLPDWNFEAPAFLNVGIYLERR